MSQSAQEQINVSKNQVQSLMSKDSLLMEQLNHKIAHLWPSQSEEYIHMFPVTYARLFPVFGCGSSVDYAGDQRTSRVVL